jgi:hypothetical protein
VAEQPLPDGRVAWPNVVVVRNCSKAHLDPLQTLFGPADARAVPLLGEEMENLVLDMREDKYVSHACAEMLLGIKNNDDTLMRGALMTLCGEILRMSQEIAEIRNRRSQGKP